MVTVNAKSDFLEQAVINAVLRGVAYTNPAVFVGLFTGNPGEGGSLADEVTEMGYARQPVTFIAPVGGATENSADVVFPVAGEPWGTITHFAIHDALVMGNVLYFGALDTPRVVDTGDQAKFLAGALDVAEL